MSARVLALLSQKGGSGKTTLAVHLAVYLGKARDVVLVDTDPQGSAAAWQRGRPNGPPLVEARAADIMRELRRLKSTHDGVLVVDTMPSVASDIAAVARAADFVLIPCRPAVLDLRAVGGTVAIVKQVRAAAAIVLNAAPARRGEGEAAVTREARNALGQYGLPVLDAVVVQRAALTHALAASLAVEEFEPEGKAAGEIRALARSVERRLWQGA